MNDPSRDRDMTEYPEDDVARTETCTVTVNFKSFTITLEDVTMDVDLRKNPGEAIEVADAKVFAVANRILEQVEKFLFDAATLDAIEHAKQHGMNDAAIESEVVP